MEGTGAVLCARVSSAGQKADLGRQVARLAAFAAERGLRVAKVVFEVVFEVGRGRNGHRKGLLSVPRSPDDSAIVVEHRDPPSALWLGVWSISRRLWPRWAAKWSSWTPKKRKKQRTIWCKA